MGTKFERKRTKRVGKTVRVSMFMVFLGLIVMVIVVYNLYSRIFVPNVNMDTEQELFYIPTGSDYEYVIDKLEEDEDVQAVYNNIA